MTIASINERRKTPTVPATDAAVNVRDELYIYRYGMLHGSDSTLNHIYLYIYMVT